MWVISIKCLNEIGIVIKRWYKIHIFFTLILHDEILVLHNVINSGRSC